MPTEYLHPGVYVEEVPSGVHAISGVPTSTALFIGWAPRGPVDGAVRIQSFADFQRHYGGLDARARLGHALGHFFANGGTDAWVIRLAAADARTAKGRVGGLSIAARSPGDWANGLGIVTVRQPEDPTRFRLDVTDANNAALETFTELSMKAGDQHHAPAMINARSTLIKASRASAATPANGTVRLSGGADGAVAGPDTSGSRGAKFRADLLALFAPGGLASRIDLVNIVCVPGLVDAPTIAALQTCARERRAFLLVDCAESATADDVIASLAGKTGADADHAAFYFPWVMAPDPLQGGALKAFPPSGFVAGLFARTDANRGVWKAPAGSEASLNGAAGLTVKLTDAQNGRLNPRAINCLRSFPVNGTVAWGARTMAGDDSLGSEWKYVPVRRTALFIEESLYRGLKWAVFEPNDEPLWAQLRLNIGAFMQGLFRQGAFQGRTPREAYFVKCDRETTTQADVDNGVVNIVVGFAPLKPAEFVVIKLQQIAGRTVA